MSPPALQTRRLSIGPSEWLVRDSGPRDPAQPTAVFIAGLGSGDYLCRHATLLAADRRVLLPDMPGFGHSRRPQTVRAVDEFAGALLELLRAETDQRVDLVGNSFGTQIALAAAQMSPAAFRRLVLIGPTFDAAARTLPKMFFRWIRDMPKEPPALSVSLAHSYALSGIRAPLRAFRAGMRDQPEARMASIPHRVLLLRGGRDTIAPRSWLETLQRAGSRVEIAEVATAAHTVDYAAPEETAAVVSAFLRRP